MTPIFYNYNESATDVASRLRAVIESAVDGIITIDEHGIIEFVNPATTKIFGYSSEEMIGNNISMLMPSPYRERHDQYMNSYKESGIKKIIGIGREVPGKKKDGTTFPFWLSVSEVGLENKKLFTGIVHDMTEQKRIEEDLIRFNHELEDKINERTEKLSSVVSKMLETNQQLQHEIQERKAIEQALLMSREELRNTQELLQQIVSSYPDGTISVVDKDFNYLFTGGEMHVTLGNDAKQLIGKPIFSFMEEETIEQIKKDLACVFEGEIIHDYEVPQVFHGYHFALEAFPLRNATDETISRVAIFTRNISELKKIEAELRAALQKERELGELKSRFVSMASHEFRTPLSTILSSASLMSQYTLTEQQDKREKHFTKIKSAVSTLTGILNDFLSLARLEEGRVEVNAEEFEFNQFCSDVIDEMQSILKPEQAIIANHFDERVSVVLDKKLLKLILINLISNASKYSEDGTDIICNTELIKNRFTISIKDHGIGIPDEDKPHMFDRFFRASNAMNIKGTGLGLNIVKRYIEIMGGTISFESELGKGSIFTVVFNLKGA